MNDSEIVDELVRIAAAPTDCNMSWGDTRWRVSVEALDGFWRGVIQGLARRRERQEEQETNHEPSRSCHHA
jgi:hypothetical protein